MKPNGIESIAPTPIPPQIDPARVSPEPPPAAVEPKKPSMDVLEVLSQHAPRALEALREIVRTFAAPEIDAVRRGLDATPRGTEEAFLQAADAVLAAKEEEARRAIPSAGAAVDPASGIYKPQSGARVEVDFSLFFEASERVSVRQSADASGSYYEATREVAARFEAGASIKILGDHLELSEIASRLDPGVFDAFQSATRGLSDLDDAAVARFHESAAALFDEIGQEVFGDADALDHVAARLTATAESFVASVESGVADTFQAPGAAPNLFDRGSDLLGALDAARAALAPRAEDETPDSPLRRLLASLNALSNHEAAKNPVPEADLGKLLAA